MREFHFTARVICFTIQGITESEGRSGRTPCTSREDLTLAISMNPLLSPVEPLKVDYDRERIEDIGYMTCMTLVLLGNYAQTGHFGGPLAYTPYNVALHLAGPELGGLRYDYRKPKHPFCDKFMLAGGHNIPTAYALWMIMGEAMARKHARTGDPRYYVDPQTAIVSIDALGFRRGAGACSTCCRTMGLPTIRSLLRPKCVVFGPWRAMRKRPI